MIRAFLGSMLQQAWDQYHGVETCRITETTAPHGKPYEPSSRRQIRSLIAAAQIDPASYTFVDIGCGKGRVLFIAAEHPFLRIEGVEYSEHLYQVGSQNIQRWRGRLVCNKLSITHADAALYEFPADPLVLFLHNPFDVPVMEKFVANLWLSYERLPRDIVILCVGQYTRTKVIEQGFPNMKEFWRRGSLVIFRLA